MQSNARGEAAFPEFVAMMALTVSIVALSIDLMLAALPRIGEDLQIADPNSRQLIVSMVTLGLALSPIPFGVASDAFGRKPAILAGLGLFALGSLVAALSQDFTTLLIGRFMQGLGAAAPRTLAMSVVRDRTEGRAMARVMSFIMATFILAPAVAPSLGLAIEHSFGWRAEFLALLALALLIAVWLGLRLPETLPREKRRPARWREVRDGVVFALGDRRSLGYSIASGFLFGAFLSYISSSQQIIGEAYGWGDGFALVFSGLALCLGAAAFVNSQLVMRYGMRPLSRLALSATLAASLLFIAASAFGTPPFWVFALWAGVAFFCFGLSVGNLNALAMAPLGAIAGLGAAIVATITNLLSVPLAVVVAGMYDGDALPIVAGFCLFSVASLLAMRWADAGAEQESGKAA